MKLNTSNFTLEEVPFTTKAYMLLLPVFGIIFSLAWGTEETAAQKVSEKEKFELPKAKATKKMTNRSQVDNASTKEIKGSINQDYSWEDTPQTSDNDNFTDFAPEKENQNQEVKAQDTKKKNYSSVYNDEQIEGITELMKELKSNKKQNPENHKQSNSQSNNKRNYSSNVSTHKSVTKAKPIRRKERIFSKGSGEIYASHSNNPNNKNNKTETTTYSDIKVKVHGDYSKLTKRSKITVRTTENYVIDGHNVPLGTFISGITDFKNNRLDIRFTALYLNEKIIPVRFQAYSEDGLRGMFIEGGVPDEDRKEIEGDLVDEATNEINVPVPIIGNVIKSFIKRKNGKKKTYVHVPSNYPLILKKLK